MLSPDARLRRLLAPDGVVDALVELIDQRAGAIVEQRILARERAREDWITIGTAVEISGLSAPAIRERVRRGFIEAKRDGSWLLIRRLDAEGLRPGCRYDGRRRE
jgi:hypothetical protein